MRIADVLQSKGTAVLTVAPDVTVRQVIDDMARHNVGAFVVVQNNEVLGMISERDIIRRLHRCGAGALGTPISEIMSTTVFTCALDDSVDSLAATMTEHRIRHLPVVVEGSLRGIVSIGDVVKSRMDELETERDHLESYIHRG
ncbi:CBS domain-containing protein [Tomitella fengzijianii]|uniref:CBS domain-containing protein n=1 Tax=Tomitella fengzijianii TaxID=2597660 RepID=A0A516X2A5_9ACTN|nr:CBS domain-containing protein [Tomitella fengzijianii]QDQ96741.1 CBS domain-containing protein [Tomitella fengzijianii]